MLEGSFVSTSESRLKKKEIEVFDPSFPLSATCSALKPKWLAKIATQRQSILRLTSQVLSEEASMATLPYHSTLPLETSSLSLIDRLKIQQKNSLHVISNLTKSLLSFETNEELSSELVIPQLKEKQLIKWLEEKGYTDLAEKLLSRNGYPWDDIKTVRCPILIEQLVDLYCLCLHKSSSKDISTTKTFMDFALNLAKTATAPNLKNNYTHSHELAEDSKRVLGQLIFLINKNPKLALKAIDQSRYDSALKSLNIEFNIAIQEICHQLQDHYVAHYETQLQSPDVAIQTMIPLELAKALLTDIGTINVGIIDTLSDIFLSQEERHFDHEANLSYALKLLQRSPKLRSEFEKIHCPNSNKMASNDVIRASLGLDCKTPITDFHTRLAALIALLSHLRQGGDGSCFAVSLAIEILSAHLGFCFKDLRQLLQESKLTRQVKNVKKDIPFVKRISDENLDRKIKIDKKGCLILEHRKGAEIWEAPGIQAVCLSLGLSNCKEALQTIIIDLFNKEGHSCELTIKDLIKKLSDFAYQQKSSAKTSLSELYSQACFVFSSQTSQPLLKIWENAIASMAEAEEGSMVKTAILDSVMDALQFKLGDLQIPPSRLLQHFFLNIQKQLYKGIQLQYDPSIQADLEDRKHSKVGGFVLYHKEKRIENQSSFRTFVNNILLKADQALSNCELIETEKKQLKQVISILTTYINTEDFMNYLLVRYHPSNKLALSQLRPEQSLPYDALPFTPWVTRTGNNSKAVLKVYLEAEQPIATERFVSNGAEEALSNIIEMCKRMSEQEKRLFINNPNKLKPFCILGKHRLPFMAGHSSLASAWQQKKPTEEWIKKYVLDPGLAIAHADLDSLTRDQLLNHLQGDILPAFLPKDKAIACMDLIKKIKEPITICRYRNALLKICQKAYTSKAPIMDKIARQIDTALCHSLKPELKKKLEESAVHFADTNWCSGIHDIHFCFAVNPGSGKLELWEAYSNGSHLAALDQNYWLFNQKWEFLTIPEELIPDDSYEII